MQFHHLFPTPSPIIGVIHLQALPGAPLYQGNLQSVYDQAIAEAEIFNRHVDGIIIENFRDAPFYPDTVPPETIATMAAIGREVTNRVQIPVGINVLRNDANAAIAIATAIDAQFIRINVHINAVVADQGIIEGKAYQSLRLRAALQSKVLIFADIGVKHAKPLAGRGLGLETKDLTERGLVDAVIVSGTRTGETTSLEDLQLVKSHSKVPVLIGSGTTPESLPILKPYADGFIVGSYFKRDGKADNEVLEGKVENLKNIEYGISNTEYRTLSQCNNPIIQQ